MGEKRKERWGEGLREREGNIDVMVAYLPPPRALGILRALDQEECATLGFVPWGDSPITERPAGAHFSHYSAELIKSTSQEETERARAHPWVCVE